MAKRPKPKRKAAKRGPKEDRLVITDVQAALDKMWTAKKRFDDAHRDGMSALKNGDYGKLGDAIERERLAIEEQRAALIPPQSKPKK